MGEKKDPFLFFFHEMEEEGEEEEEHRGDRGDLHPFDTFLLSVFLQDANGASQ